MVSITTIMMTLGFHIVESADHLKEMGWPVVHPETGVVGTELVYSSATPKADHLSLVFQVKGAKERMVALFGPPVETPLGEAWLFAFDDLPFTGFEVKVVGPDTIVVSEWTVRRYRYWTAEEAEPLTQAFLSALRRGIE